MLFVARCALFVACCLLLACLFDYYYSLRVVLVLASVRCSWLLVVGRGLLFVVCCLLFVVDCWM